jgi:DNA-binding MarR family transcriptional regulator
MEDPADRRRKLVRLTARGRQVHQRAVQQAYEVNESLLRGLAETDRFKLAAILNELVDLHHGILEHHE